MNIWKDLSKERVNEDEFIACIEISKGSKMKYELDKIGRASCRERV